jgi:transketolase
MEVKSLTDLRKLIITASSLAHEGHVPSAFSILEILYIIYVVIPTKHDLVVLKDFDFILSKGHGSLALYAALTASGHIDESWVQEFCKDQSNYGGHPDRNKVSGVVASTGSLGHGLPITIGRILANRQKNLKQKSFCLIGDGELNEGSIWESLMLAENFKLNELCLIVDNNNSTTRAVTAFNLEEKLKSFGFQVFVIDGHDLIALEKTLTMPLSQNPVAVITNTIKGKGLRDMENSFEWHHRSPNKNELSIFLEELK